MIFKERRPQYINSFLISSSTLTTLLAPLPPEEYGECNFLSIFTFLKCFYVSHTNNDDDWLTKHLYLHIDIPMYNESVKLIKDRKREIVLYKIRWIDCWRIGNLCFIYCHPFTCTVPVLLSQVLIYFYIVIHTVTSECEWVSQV